MSGFCVCVCGEGGGGGGGSTFVCEMDVMNPTPPQFVLGNSQFFL